MNKLYLSLLVFLVLAMYLIPVSYAGYSDYCKQECCVEAGGVYQGDKCNNMIDEIDYENCLFYCDDYAGDYDTSFDYSCCGTSFVLGFLALGAIAFNGKII